MASSRALERSISTGNVICVRVISMIIGTLHAPAWLSLLGFQTQTRDNRMFGECREATWTAMWMQVGP